jgi:hypothetical protein
LATEARVADLFVSYSQADRDCAFGLVQHVERSGFTCWIAPRDIAPAADWAEQIIDGISGSRIMVLVFSAHSNRSQQVRREVERAAHKEIPILPFRIEDVLPSKSLEYFLSAQHWFDAYPGPLEAHCARLCEYLRSSLRSQGNASVGESGAHRPPVAGGQDFAPSDLRRFERLLAGYIGPMARHFVKQAAACAVSMEDLVQRLATELENESDRRRFSAACRSEPADDS